jgi:hypothetical protein
MHTCTHAHTCRPHLDDGTRSGAWRNGLLLHPSTKYNGTFRWGICLRALPDSSSANVPDCAAQTRHTRHNTTRWRSYEDVMLVPLADALRAALDVTAAEGTLKAPPGRARPVVYFALQVRSVWLCGCVCRLVVRGVRKLATAVVRGPPAGHAHTMHTPCTQDAHAKHTPSTHHAHMPSTPHDRGRCLPPSCASRPPGEP